MVYEGKLRLTGWAKEQKNTVKIYVLLFYKGMGWLIFRLQCTENSSSVIAGQIRDFFYTHVANLFH